MTTEEYLRKFEYKGRIMDISRICEYYMSGRQDMARQFLINMGIDENTISTILDFDTITQKIHEEKMQKIKAEQERRDFANSFNEYYEYDVVTIVNKNHGQVDKENMKRVLMEYARDGWKLHTMYSNELGKNALRILGFGVNETACEDVLIFERRIKDIDG